MKAKILILLCLLGSVAASAQTATAVYLPKYIQGVGNFNPADDRKVPYVSRITLSGLKPNATYRYYNRFVADTLFGFDGDGPFLVVKDSGSFVRVLSPALEGPNNYGEFTTNASGAYTGWFANEPGSGFNFLTGIQIWLRIVLNDGAGGGFIDQLLTVPEAVTVINFGSDPASGTALRSTPLKRAAAKQFVLLYDNLLGIVSGQRPIAGTFIESDGTVNSVANGYAPFYADQVDGINRAWGTILPNNLASGIRHIAVLGLQDASLQNLYLSFDGKWPSVNNGAINTKNTTGGLSNVLVIDGSRIALINFWLNAEQTDELLVTLQWNTADEDNATGYTVERSDDGKTFAAVNSIQKTSNKGLYETRDSRSEQPVFYRVKMDGKDGVVLYSDVLKVDGVLKLSVFPNPVVDQLTIRHSAAEAGAAVQVIAADGHQVLTQNVQKGTVQTTVSVSRLLPGSYHLVYRVNGQKQSRTFVKQ
ncbi:MAG: T9SS type A sorting domain-containing protein [Candidatus Pseudobacter hemicellulosilyticus]|uniref:T9SS type A sorting domain-containing protein n=1 Tax=Candidatus Pseudobacter hemicellulosilyticus TaxID=3121375 RepID=A0AAJ6BFL4_9BACT|nr:MAG: T9SS type A sorting domain-containing protein [Pseudobacter sp.]